MYRPVQAIEVRIWDERVGAVSFDDVAGCYAFEYDPKWIRHKIELSPMTLPNRNGVFVFPSLPVNTYQRLPAMLADALPDDFGNALVDAYLAKQGVPKQRITALDRLAYLGKRGMGALEFRPALQTFSRKPTAVSLSQLVLASRKALAGELSGDRETLAAIKNLIQVGTSAGGARAKAVIAWNPTTLEIRSGQLPAEDGFEHWLIKFDGVGSDLELGASADYGRIEYAYYLMALAAGIKMMPSRLLEEQGRAHFMTKRFDRYKNVKHHVQSLCALGHLDFKQRATHDYSQLFHVIDQLGLPIEARQCAFRRMAFNVAASNCDDHTKNFAFILERDSSWQLAPAYDVTHAYNANGAWTYQHLLSVGGKFRDITRGDLFTLGERFQVPAYRELFEQVTNAIAQWSQFASQAGLPEPVAKTLQRDFPNLE
jgi:serine/threonine-protein kinase HipA